MSSGELLDIQPHELQFPFELGKQIPCSLQLSNKTDNYVAFEVKTIDPEKYCVWPKTGAGLPRLMAVQVKTKNPKKYCVRPKTGVVLPRSTCDVTVTMQAQKEAPADLQCKDKFLLRSVVAIPGTTTKDINREMFNREAGHSVEACKLRVVYVAPPRPPSPLREGSDEDSSPRVSVSENGHSNVEWPGSSATEEQTLDAMKGLGLLNSMIDGETQNGSPAMPPNHNPTSMPGWNLSSGEYNNSGIQMMKGLSNQTGFTLGNYNGAIRCHGDFNVYIGTTSQGRETSDPPQPSRSCTNLPPPPPPPPPVMGRGIYRCYCDVASPLKTCKTVENYDRKFYGCGQFKLHGRKACDFFIWADKDMTEQ